MMGEEYEMTVDMQEAFQRYFDYGFEPGSFGMAVLSNDLVGAVLYADPWNKKMLPGTVQWLLDNAPYGSWGNSTLVKEWLSKGVAFQQHQKDRVVDILSTP
jgi:hypothetical protein